MLEFLEDRLLLDGTIIEDFGSGDLSGYTTVLRFAPYAEITPGAGHAGRNALLKHDGYEWLIRNDDDVQVGQGQTLSVWTRFAGTADGRAYFGFGARPNNFNDFLNTGGMLSLVAAPNTGQLLLQQNRGFQHVILGAAKQEYSADHWYRMEVTWAVGGNLTGKLFDSDGTTLLQTVSGSSTVFSSGGIAFRAFGGDKYFDSVTVDGGQHPSGPHTLLAPARVQRSYLGGSGRNGAEGIPNPFQYVSVPDTGIDIQLRRLDNLLQIARVGGRVGLSAAIDTPNVGKVQVGWGPIVQGLEGNFIPIETPLLQLYMFRQLPNEATLQIGKSDVKHFFGSPGVDPQYLRPGEDDAYGASGTGSQGDQNIYGPVDDMNPVTGDVQTKDYFGVRDDDNLVQYVRRQFRDRIEHLLEVNVADLDPAQNPAGTRWFLAGNLFVPGDEHIENNSRWQEYRPIYNGTNFTFSTVGSGGENIRTMPGLNPFGGPSAPSQAGGAAAVLINQLQPAKQPVMLTATQFVEDAYGQGVSTAGPQNKQGSVTSNTTKWSVFEPETEQGHHAHRGHVALLDELFSPFFWS